MKHYVFGDTVKGFIDYLRYIWRMKADIKNYEYSRNEEFKQYRYKDYREAKARYKQFKDFKKVLFDNELATIEYEKGKRTLPFTIYYKLIQLLNFDFGIIDISEHKY